MGPTLPENWLLVTFGAGSRGYRIAANRLSKQATNSGMFSKSIALDERSLGSRYPEFWNHHSFFINKHKRGFGYWLWKPYIIKEMLSSLPSGWGLAYLDAGCVLNANRQSLSRLEAYKSHATEHSIWATELVSDAFHDFRNSTWCKADALHYLGSNQWINESNQVQGGIMMLTKTRIATEVTDSWFSSAIADGYHYLDDSDSNIVNPVNFVQHRHDQALFSVIFRHFNLTPMKDETFFPNSWESQGRNFPIWAPRWTYSTEFRPGGKKSVQMRVETANRLGVRGVLSHFRRKIT